jgi:hypothetical protein
LTGTTAPVGTFEWVAATGGQLTAAERRRLLRPLAAVHAVNAVGRAAMLIHLNSGRHADIDPAELRPPASALASAAEREARTQLSPTLLNHSYRAYAFGAALGVLADVDVDRELQTAITMHYSPRVTLADGPVAYLLAAGAGVDVAGLRSWELPPSVFADVIAQRPRLDFKREFAGAFRAEAAAVPRGRARLLRRYGAFNLAIKLAPFRT